MVLAYNLSDGNRRTMDKFGQTLGHIAGPIEVIHGEWNLEKVRPVFAIVIDSHVLDECKAPNLYVDTRAQQVPREPALAPIWTSEACP